MLSALLISMPAFNGGVSVLNSATETPAEAPTDTNANSNANNANPSENTNGALIETPATDQFANQAVNVSSNTNTAVKNTNVAAPKPAASPKKPAANK